MSRNVVVISIEGVSTAQVGAYGANTAQTKSMDAIAAHGIVLDQCFLDSRDALENLLSLWTGEHTIRPTQSASNSSNSMPRMSLWNKLDGQSSVFVTDCALAAELAEQHGCSRVVLVDTASSAQPVEEVSQSAFFSLLATAAEVMEQLSETSSATKLLWIHSRGLRMPWDAPTSLRSRFKDADDPDPPTELGPPLLRVDAETDPDLVLGWAQAAAAQVGVFDDGIEFMRDFVEQLEQDWAWCLLGLNAFPLGEHGWVGDGDVSLNNHQLQVVAIFSPQPRLPIGWRVDSICQLPDVGASIAQMCGIEEIITSCDSGSVGLGQQITWGRSQLELPDDQPPSQWDCRHQSALIVEQGNVWLRVPAWSLRLATDGTASLFVQPDDHWEINEVGSRCREIVEELEAVSQQFIQAASMGDRGQLPKLREANCNLLR